MGDMLAKSYVNKSGYREKKHSNLIHRQVAYNQIYKQDRKKYQLRFSEYQVHHKRWQQIK